jgi:hypothetical protein
MEKIIIAGVEINKVSIKNLLFNKTMLLAYIFLAIGVYGIYETILERYFLETANAFTAGMHPGSEHVAQAMKEAVFGEGGEINRESPWGLFIVNYMYMIYSGSGIIFLVALGELLGFETIKKTAAGFMTLGLAIVFGGLFTINLDLNVLHMHWMFLSPNLGAGMWMMLPLYTVYIPFVLFEIYLLVTNNHSLAKKIAVPILLLSIIVDIIEYFIQAKLFNGNIARHLWITYPNLTFYFIISAFVASVAIMILYSFMTYKDKLKSDFDAHIDLLRKTSLVAIVLLAVYEVIAFKSIDSKWASIILSGGLKNYFYSYVILALVLPFLLLLVSKSRAICSAIFMVIGTYIARFIFVYGGNAYPLSDRAGTGFQKYGEYEAVKDFIFVAPHMAEVYSVIGSFGVILAVYTLLNKLFSVSKVRDH